MSIPAGSQLCIREVWDRNLSTEIAHINRLKDKFCFLAIDTEFPGALSWKNPHQTSQEDHEYQILKVNVDNLALIQLGLTLTDEHGNLPIIDSTYCIWQFNFCDFDINTDIYSPPSIELLINAGIDFQKHRTDGLEAWKFGAYLVKYDLVCNSNMQYICFSGDYDFAYLLKVLTGELLPHTKAEFDLKVRQFFGAVHDLKDLQSKHLLIDEGGLNHLAGKLGIKRIGAAHQAGSDSFLTSSCFQKIKEKYLKGP